MPDDITGIRRELHRRPEIGLDLPHTQGLVRDFLTGLGLDPVVGRDCSSVTTVIRGEAGPAGSGPRRTVLLRADMDALPIRETADVDYRSRIRDAMHACGHDLHTAALLGAARTLVQSRDTLPGDVVLMFQPGEEGFDGARIMLNEGVLGASGARPDAAWALHVVSNLVPPGVFAGRPGALMAASALITVTVRGTGGHAATPHLTRDPVLAAAEMVTGLYAMTFRSLSPFTPVVLSVGHFEAGTRANVIPGAATFAATLRCFDTASMKAARDLVARFCVGTAHAHNVEVDIRVEPKYPVTVNDPGRAADAAAVAARTAGPDRWRDLPDPLATSEDFAHVLNQVPGAMVLLGAAPAGGEWSGAPVNHAPDVVFDDAVLPDAAGMLVALARHTLAGPDQDPRSIMNVPLCADE
jgi:amidohydrolase